MIYTLEQIRLLPRLRKNIRFPPYTCLVRTHGEQRQKKVTWIFSSKRLGYSSGACNGEAYIMISTKHLRSQSI